MTQEPLSRFRREPDWQSQAHSANYVRTDGAPFTVSAEQCHEPGEVGDAGIRRGKRLGPNNSTSIHPYSLHASGARAYDISMRFIAYKQYFRRFQCQ